MRPRIGSAPASTRVGQADPLERVDAARREGEVDRAAALGARARAGRRGARTRSRAWPRRARKQASSEPARPGADDRDLVARLAHGRLDAPRRARRRRASSRGTWSRAAPGARRTTSGSRASAITPCSWRSRSDSSPRVARRRAIDSWQPRRSGSRGRDASAARRARSSSSSDSQVAGQPQRLRSRSAVHADLRRTARSDDAARAPATRIGGLRQLPAVGARLRPRTRAHREAGGRVVAPPAGQPRQRRCRARGARGRSSRDGARPAVEVLVGAPGREVDVPVVQAQRHVAGGVGEVPADDGAGARGPRR